MPTITAFPERALAARRAAPRRAFTLVEMLVSTGLSGIVLVAILSAVLMITRSGYLLNNYIEMENSARTALETFAVDSRMTENVAWTRASDSAPLTAITLQDQAGASVTYTYNSSAGTLVRTGAGGDTRVMIRGIQSFTFTAYKYNMTDGLQAIVPSEKTLTAVNNETKMVQLSLATIRSRATLADATNTVVSARFVLRNKIITN